MLGLLLVHLQNYVYVDHDGIHMPDAHAGDRLLYEIGYGEFLQSIGGGVLERVEWVVDLPLVHDTDAGKLDLNKKVVGAMIETPIPGLFSFQCLVTARDNDGREHQRTVKLIVRVYS